MESGGEGPWRLNVEGYHNVLLKCQTFSLLCFSKAGILRCSAVSCLRQMLISSVHKSSFVLGYICLIQSHLFGLQQQSELTLPCPDTFFGLSDGAAGREIKGKDYCCTHRKLLYIAKVVCLRLRQTSWKNPASVLLCIPQSKRRHVFIRNLSCTRWQNKVVV